MGKTISIFKEALKNIISNKLRSSLTMLGLIIGIMSVILLVGIGNGATTNVTSSVKSLGTGTLTVSINGESDTTIQYEQIDDFKKITNIESVAPYKNVSGTISKDTTTSRNSSVLATVPEYINILNLKLEAGRLLSNIDIENSSKICMIGNSLTDTLFEDSKIKDIVGQSISIEGDKYTVVGVLTKVGSSMGTNIDNTIIIPFTTAKYLKSDMSINNLYVKVSDENNIEATKSLIENYLERKSLGAKRRDILVQFLVESLILCILGGTIGVGFGIGVGTILQIFGFSFNITSTVILISFCSSAVIGLVFGIFPAYKAAKLNPIEALRTE